MAKYILGSGVAQFKGSRNGATFQKCGKVFAIRKRSVIVQKRSAKQSKAKNLFASKTQNWRRPSFINKASYNNRATMYTRINSLGNSYNMTGQQMQTGTNCIRSLTNRADLTVVAAPASFTTISQASWSMFVGASSLLLGITPNQIASGFDIQIFTSLPLSNGLQAESVSMFNVGRFIQNQFSNVINFYSAYVARSGSLANASGLSIYVRMDLIQNNSGQVRQTLYGSLTVS